MTSCLPPHIREIMIDMHRMRLELERSLDQSSAEDVLFSRTGSIRGRNLHVFNTIRRIREKQRFKRDYLSEDDEKIVVYITSCAIVRKVWERCRDTVDLLKCLDIRCEFRDLNLDTNYVDELVDRMDLEEENRNLVFESLPMVYVNGKYFGNDSTLFEENEKKNLTILLGDFKGHHNCNRCAGSGYTVCQKCDGGKKGADRFDLRLRCAACDRNGIAPCSFCSPNFREL